MSTIAIAMPRNDEWMHAFSLVSRQTQNGLNEPNSEQSLPKGSAMWAFVKARYLLSQDIRPLIRFEQII